MNLLLLNAGSSSLKASIVDARDGQAIVSSIADWAGAETRFRLTGPERHESTTYVPWKGHAEAVRHFVSELRVAKAAGVPALSTLKGVGHRVVHGGPFRSSVRITPEVRSQISALVDLAPLHNPPSLEALAAAERELPDVPHVAVFDTAFHSTLPAHAFTYPIPERWTRVWGIRRFGFHGLNYAYCARRAAEMLDRPSEGLRLVICHLGHGCSAAAVKGGKSVDTTMGFTPLEGLMMGTRSGSIDPSIVLHVEQRHGLSATEMETALNRESGLLGVSGTTADMRQILASAGSGDGRAKLALDIYVHRIRQAIGAFAVTLGGIDALVFTAGVGENSSEVRELVCEGLEHLGLELDRKANLIRRPDADLALEDSRGRILVIAAREDVTMLREVSGVLG